MAHGGDPAWNRAVEDAVAPLRERWPVEIAFGMADSATMQDAIRRLEAGGANRIGVVRLFASGESWYDRTRQILGLDPGAPARPEAASADGDRDHVDAAHVHHIAHGGHSMEFWRVESAANFALSSPGLLEDLRMGDVLAERARTLSRQPETEDVLILAHGPGDDGQNARWLAHLDRLADRARRALPFRRVTAMTLREDWPVKRAEAERRIRDYVQRATDDGGRALVIPFRVQGFGPYRDVLVGLDYVADGEGLLPHVAVTDWMSDQAERLRAGPFE